MKNPFRAICAVVAIAGIMLGTSAFTGCATDGGGPAATAQTTVFQVEQQYNHGLAVGAWYGSLEDCATSLDKILCSKPDVRTKIKQAKDVAGPIVAGARATVRNPLFDQSTSAAIVITATNAVSVLTAITGPLEALLNQAIQQGKAQPIAMVATPHMSVGASPDHPRLPAPQFADFGLVAILSLLNMLLKVIPEGTAQWLKIKSDRDKYQQIKDEGRNPTDEEWQTLIDETSALEAQIDANAAR